jgi:hypothetical protein
MWESAGNGSNNDSCRNGALIQVHLEATNWVDRYDGRSGTGSQHIRVVPTRFPRATLNLSRVSQNEDCSHTVQHHSRLHRTARSIFCLYWDVQDGKERRAVPRLAVAALAAF